jgi:hypothetical protein
MNSKPASSPQTYEALAEDAQKLLAEIDAALGGNAFAILNNQTRSTLQRYYDAAALRHCCVLFSDIETCSKAEQEITVRILGRVFIEAWFTALYIHFGGWNGFERVAQNTAYQSALVDRAIKKFDSGISRAKKIARQRYKVISRTNSGISFWNQANPTQPAKELHPEPYIPTLRPTGIDVSRRITQDLKGVEQISLSVEELTRLLTELGPEKGFARETFEPLYLWYRIFSAGTLHATLNVYDAYYHPGHFDRVAPGPRDASLIPQVRITALYCTALLARAVLSDAHVPSPIASDLASTYAPDPKRASWTPGI